MHRSLHQAAAPPQAPPIGATPTPPPPPPPLELPPPGAHPAPAQLAVAVFLITLMAAATVVLALGCRTLRFALGLKRCEVALLEDEDDPRRQRRRRRAGAAAAAPPLPRRPAPPPPRRLTPQSVVDAIPLAAFADIAAPHPDDPNTTSPSPSCVVCLADFAQSDTVRVLRCGHLFHPPCIDAWLTQRDDCCPLCKAPVGVLAEGGGGVG